MSSESYIQKERRLFRRAVWAAILLHAVVLIGIVWAERPGPDSLFRPLAVVDFAHFDPEGGKPGGSLDDDAAVPAEAPAPEAQPEPEAAPEPETQPDPEPVPEPEVIESVSEKAVPLSSPPKETKPKPKPAPKQAAAQIAEAGTGEKEARLPGGGPGQGQGGLGGGSGQGNPNELNAYLAQVRKRLNSSKKYPPSARSQKMEGVATVSFILAPDGRVLSSRLVKSSGHAILDDEVMALLRRISPLPRRPKNLPQDNLSLTVPIQYSLR